MENREWKEYKIKDVGTVITGKTPSKNNPEDWGDEMPFVTPSDYKHYRKFAKFSDRNLSSIGIDLEKTEALHRDMKREYYIRTVIETEINNTPYRYYYKFKTNHWFVMYENEWIRLDKFFTTELRKEKLKNIKNGI